LIALRRNCPRVRSTELIDYLLNRLRCRSTSLQKLTIAELALN